VADVVSDGLVYLTYIGLGDGRGASGTFSRTDAYSCQPPHGGDNCAAPLGSSVLF
jgi:hypothetical protein